MSSSDASPPRRKHRCTASQSQSQSTGTVHDQGSGSGSSHLPSPGLHASLLDRVHRYSDPANGAWLGGLVFEALATAGMQLAWHHPTRCGQLSGLLVAAASVHHLRRASWGNWGTVSVAAKAAAVPLWPDDTTVSCVMVALSLAMQTLAVYATTLYTAVPPTEPHAAVSVLLAAFETAVVCRGHILGVMQLSSLFVVISVTANPVLMWGPVQSLLLAVGCGVLSRGLMQLPGCYRGLTVFSR